MKEVTIIAAATRSDHVHMLVSIPSKLSVSEFMLLTAIWNVLSKGESYSAEGYLTDAPTAKNQVLTTQQALNLLKSRGVMIKDDPSSGPD